MKHSLLTSTLSLTFFISIMAVLVMVFKGITPDDKLLSLISGVIGAYIGSRMPSSNSSETK